MTAETGAGADAPIVIGVDGSEHAAQAVRWGASEAARRAARLLLVHALGIPSQYMGPWPPSHELREKLAERGRALLENAEKIARQAADVEVSTWIDNDNSSEVLIEASRSALMVVLGATGHGGFLAGLAVGSTATQTTSHAHSPVVIVRGDDVENRPGDQPIVVGVDGSPRCDTALGYAFAEAALRGVPLIAVHAWYDNEAVADVIDEARFVSHESVDSIERNVLEESLTGWKDKYPNVSVQSVVEHDKPRRKLLELSTVAQLVVVGSRGWGGFRGLLLGSTGQALMHHADCPVMVVRPQPESAEVRSS
ncbi:MAG: universal stress protein [Pseudonocardiaceae bacterium]|nr:universal stress protein [Pseudonocardiaceae bacterium]